MTVTTVGTKSALLVRSLVDMRRQLDELQRQLATGKRADDYAGLGLDRGLTVTLRNRVAVLDGFAATKTHVDVRLDLAQTTLTRLDAIRSEVKGAALNSQFAGAQGGQTDAQKAALAQLDEIFSLLNVRAGDRYLFSGKAADRPAVATTEQILNGDGSRAGFRQVAAERWQADRGADGRGRLVIPPAAGATVTLMEDAAGSPFGLKLASVASTLSGATVSGPSGTPPAVAVALGAVPQAGDTITIRFMLPDGSSESVTLTATAAANPAPGQFGIGATPAATAANLQAAVAAAVEQLAATALPAASAAAAADDFFNTDAVHPPRRVAGPPFATATAFVDGTAADTVSWYVGEAGTEAARATALARIDSTITVAYGMRANEPGIRSVVQAIAAFAVTAFAPDDPRSEDGYRALAQRTAAALDGHPGVQRIANIHAELANAQANMAAAAQRQQQMRAMALDLLQQIEGARPEEAGVQILALQTRLEATMQTTALLYRTSLVNFL